MSKVQNQPGPLNQDNLARLDDIVIAYIQLTQLLIASCLNFVADL